jgi:hypothetical protein
VPPEYIPLIVINATRLADFVAIQMERGGEELSELISRIFVPLYGTYRASIMMAIHPVVAAIYGLRLPASTGSFRSALLG